MLKCFQLLADALDKILTLEQVLVPNFHKQIEAMLKSMSDSKVSHPFSLPSFIISVRPCDHACLNQRRLNELNAILWALAATALRPALSVVSVRFGRSVMSGSRIF